MLVFHVYAKRVQRHAHTSTRTRARQRTHAHVHAHARTKCSIESIRGPWPPLFSITRAVPRNVRHGRKFSRRCAPLPPPSQPRQNTIPSPWRPADQLTGENRLDTACHCHAATTVSRHTSPRQTHHRRRQCRRRERWRPLYDYGCDDDDRRCSHHRLH